MPDNSIPRDDWEHLQLGETQNGEIPLDPEEIERLGQYLADLYPDLYNQLNPYINQIAELLRNRQLNNTTLNSIINDIMAKIDITNLTREKPPAVPAQAPFRRRYMPYPRPYPVYPVYRYPLYDFSPQSLIRIMLLRELGLF